MKKSTSIFLSSALTLAIASCKDKEKEWIVGDEKGQVRDTVTNNGHYRHYGGFWYPIYGGRINPGLYQGASSHSITTPGFRPVRTGGFGRTGGGRSGGFGS